MKFIRFGILQPQKQVNYGNDTFHAPPCKKGFYAFPSGYVERFLLGATDHPKNSSAKTYWLKDDNDNKILDSDIWDLDTYSSKTGNYSIKKEYVPLLKKKHIKSNMLVCIYDDDTLKHYVAVFREPKQFNYEGELWHHLDEPLQKKQHLIYKRVGSWIKTDMETYEFCMRKMAHIQYKDYMKDWERVHNKDGLKLYAKDHLEVFFEKIK